MIFQRKTGNLTNHNAIIYWNFYCFGISSVLIFKTASNHDLYWCMNFPSLFIIWFVRLALSHNFADWLYGYDCVINFIILCSEILLIMYNMLLHLVCLSYIILRESSVMTMMRLSIILFLSIVCFIVFIFTGWRYCDYI